MTSNEYWKITDTLKLIKIAKVESKGETITKDYINHLSTTVNLMREAQSFKQKEMIEKIDKLWFSYGNAIDDCIEDKDLKETKRLFEEFYVKYEEIKDSLVLKEKK